MSVDEIAILPNRAPARSISVAKAHTTASASGPNHEIWFVRTTSLATIDGGIEIDEFFAPDIPEVDVSKYGQHHVRVLVSNI